MVLCPGLSKPQTVLGAFFVRYLKKYLSKIFVMALYYVIIWINHYLLNQSLIAGYFKIWLRAIGNSYIVSGFSLCVINKLS